MLELYLGQKKTASSFCLERTDRKQKELHFLLIDFLKIVTELRLCDTLTNSVSCIADEML